VKPTWRGVRTAALLALAGAAACSDIDNHLLEGQQYYADGACLSPSEVIDDLNGSDPGDNCAPECLVVPPTGGNPQAVYITTTCPPYPNYTAELQDAAKDSADPCVGAFAAFFEDGGDICSSYDAAVEASSDAGDGGLEAAVEAGADAGVDAPTGG
jgi:hypothetical protein